MKRDPQAQERMMRLPRILLISCLVVFPITITADVLGSLNKDTEMAQASGVLSLIAICIFIVISGIRTFTGVNLLRKMYPIMRKMPEGKTAMLKILAVSISSTIMTLSIFIVVIISVASDAERELDEIGMPFRREFLILFAVVEFAMILNALTGMAATYTTPRKRTTTSNHSNMSRGQRKKRSGGEKSLDGMDSVNSTRAEEQQESRESDYDADEPDLPE